MLIQPVLRPVLQPVLRSIFDPGIGGGGTPIWAPASLFAKYSGVGGYWDFTDMATLFQDSAGTTPVTASGQPVGRVLDKSGQGNHVIQSTAGARPQYNGAGITPDGVDDFMATAAHLDLSACDKVVVAMGYTKVDSATIIQAEHGADWNSVVPAIGAFQDSNTLSFLTNAGAGVVQAGLAGAVNDYKALIGRSAGPGKESELWVDGGYAINTDVNGSGNFGSHPLYLLSRGGSAFFSNTPTRRALVLGVPVAGVQVSDEDIELIRLWLMEGA